MKNGKIIKICEEKLIFLNYASSTKTTYIHYISEFVSNLDKQVAHINAKDFQNYVDN